MNKTHYILDFIIEETGDDDNIDEFITYLIGNGNIIELNIFRKDYEVSDNWKSEKKSCKSCKYGNIVGGTEECKECKRYPMLVDNWKTRINEDNIEDYLKTFEIKDD